MPRPVALGIVLLGVAGALVVHLIQLSLSGFDPVMTPVSALSRTPTGYLHGIGLALFAVAHPALAVLLSRHHGGPMRRAANIALALSSLLVLYVAWYFATADAATLAGPKANWPLMLLASAIGTVMGLLVPGLMRTNRIAGLFDIACFAIWMTLLFISLAGVAGWIGGYERTVGIVYLIWVGGLGILVGTRPDDEPRSGFNPIPRTAPRG